MVEGGRDEAAESRIPQRGGLNSVPGLLFPLPYLFDSNECLKTEMLPKQFFRSLMSIWTPRQSINGMGRPLFSSVSVECSPQQLEESSPHLPRCLFQPQSLFGVL